MRHPTISSTFLLLTGLIPLCGSINDKTTEKNKKKPNILFFFTDDQAANALGCSGNPYINTPNIDLIAEKGVRFTNTYVMGGHIRAICAPSRAMLMSGRFLFNVYEKLDGVVTMPMHFGTHGYKTFGTGKWHYTANSFEASFQKGKNVFLGGMSDHFNVPCRNLEDDGKLSETVIKGFSTDIFAEAAINFIKEYANDSRKNPFFCYIAFTAPHDPYSPHPGYIGMYPEQSLPLPGNFLSFEPFQFYEQQFQRDQFISPWPRTPEITRAILSDYYRLISHIDNKVGEMVRTLKEYDLYDNTIIIYASDNGMAIGNHGTFGKQALYEHSSKVPFIISGKGIPEGKVSDALVYLLDIFPTLTELCNLPEPELIDGESLVPVIKGKSEEVRPSLLTAFMHTARAVRTKEWKLIRYPERDYTELFNLKKDPLELNNLAGKVEYKAKQEELTDLMREWQNIANDTASLTAKTILPLEYDYKKLNQLRKPDRHQPRYTLKKYFEIE